MQMVDSAKLPLSAIAYAEDVNKGIQHFLTRYADVLDKNLGKSQPIKDLQVSASKDCCLLLTFHAANNISIWSFACFSAILLYISVCCG